MTRAFWSVVGLVCLAGGAFGLPPGDPNSWEIEVSLFTSSAKDTQNSLGVDLLAVDGQDQSDILEPPGFPGRLSLTINPSDGLSRARDICSPVTDLRSWNLSITNLKPASLHFILFSGLDSVPAEYSVLVVDQSSGVQHDLRSAPEYLFVPTAGEIERSLELRVSNPPPNPPGELDAIGGTASANLSWQEGTDSDIVGYTVYMGTTSGIYDTSWYIGMRSDYQIDGLEYGYAYYFAVSALDRSNLEGNRSPEASIGMNLDPTPTPIPEPVMTFDTDQSGGIDYRDLFYLAGSWMYPVKLTPEGQRPVYLNVSPSLLNQFIAEWKQFRSPDTALKPVPVPTTDTDTLEALGSIRDRLLPEEEVSDGR